MLHEFIAANRDAILTYRSETVTRPPSPSVPAAEPVDGIPVFLTQLSETLRLAGTPVPFSGDAIATTAARHGTDMLRLGCSVSHVVYDYGDICQAITALALEQHAVITVEEFQILNRCVDTAIAEAMTEYSRVTAQTRSAEELERLGDTAHELRDSLNTALLSYHMLKQRAIVITGTTGAVLGRSLMSLCEQIERMLFDVRVVADTPRCARLHVVTFIQETAATASLHSEYRQIEFTVDADDATLFVDADPQLLTSAVMNLLHNAFKYTRSGGRVVLRARAENQRLLVEIEDECGGIPESKRDMFRAFGERRGRDRSGLGLGLSIARKAVRAHGGEIFIRNMPGRGCVFIVELPLAEKKE